MKTISVLLSAFCALLFSVGCASTDQVTLDNTRRAPTSTVDIYKDGRTPTRRFKEIAELSFLGPKEDELRAQKRFITQAQKMGGNGLIFKVEDAGQKGGFTAFQTTAYVFKGTVIVYE